MSGQETNQRPGKPPRGLPTRPSQDRHRHQRCRPGKHCNKEDSARTPPRKQMSSTRLTDAGRATCRHHQEETANSPSQTPRPGTPALWCHTRKWYHIIMPSKRTTEAADHKTTHKNTARNKEGSIKLEPLELAVLDNLFSNEQFSLSHPKNVSLCPDLG